MLRVLSNALAGVLDGKKAIKQAFEQNRLDRYFTFPNLARSAVRCGEELERAGLSDVEVEDFPADGRTTWSGWRAMKAWDVESAKLVMTEPYHRVISEWETSPIALMMYSMPCETEGPLVVWNGEKNVDLKGKIPVTECRVMTLQ